VLNVLAGRRPCDPDKRSNVRMTEWARHAIPAIYSVREFADSGGLISYGPHFLNVYQQVYRSHPQGGKTR